MYTVLIMQNDTTPAVYAFATENEALAYYHNELAYRAEGRVSTRCAILDPDFNLIRQETYSIVREKTEEAPEVVENH